ncbi:MAG: hypothetical protein ACLFTT_07575 [Candidatus Hydrogenedentota bacterium]
MNEPSQAKHIESPGDSTPLGFVGIALRVMSVAMVALALSAALALVFTSRTHNLANHGNWMLGQFRVNLTLVNTDHFFTETQTLAGNQLNLGAWQSYHEVIREQPLHCGHHGV